MSLASNLLAQVETKAIDSDSDIESESSSDDDGQPMEFQEFLRRASVHQLTPGATAYSSSSDNDDSDDSDDSESSDHEKLPSIDSRDASLGFSAFVRRASFLDQQASKASGGIRDDRLSAISENERGGWGIYGASKDAYSSSESSSSDEDETCRLNMALIQSAISPDDPSVAVGRYLVGSCGNSSRYGSGYDSDRAVIRPKGPYSSSDSSSSSEDEFAREDDDEEDEDIMVSVAEKDRISDSTFFGSEATKTENQRRFEAFMKALAEKKALGINSGNGGQSEALLQRLSSTAAVLQARSSDSHSMKAALPVLPDALPENKLDSGSCSMPASETEPQSQLPPQVSSSHSLESQTRRMSCLDVSSNAARENQAQKVPSDFND